MHVVLVEFTVKPEFFDQFLARVGQQATDSLEKEVDCHRFDVCVDRDSSESVLLYEIYSDQAAFGAHLKTDHFKQFDQETKEWFQDKKVKQLRLVK